MKKIVGIISTFLLLTNALNCQYLWGVDEVPMPDFDNCRLCRAYGDYVYTSQYPEIFIVVDVHNPADIEIVNTHDIPVHGYITIAEDFLYLAAGAAGNTVYIFDISDPESPVLLNTVPTSVNSCDLEARGNYLYVCGYNFGLVIYDITSRVSPVELARITDVGLAYGIKLSEDLMYVGVQDYGLKIYNIADPADPELISSIYLSCGDWAILTKDKDHVFFSTYTNGQKIIDVSDPASPEVIATINPTGYDRYVEVANDRMFLGNWSSGAMMYDVTDVTQPVFLNSVPPYFTGTMDVHVCGANLYVADLSHFRSMAYEIPEDGYYRKARMSYNWIEIENTGDPHDMGPDHFSERISIGFSFPFYDNIYQYLWICSNGFIAFNNYSPSRWDTPIPCDTQPNDIIAPFWDDFNPAGSPTNVYTQLFINPTYFVIEFVDMPRVGTNEYETFEIIITPGGHIKFQYPEVVNATSATVGIENETGTRGSQWAHNPHCNIPHSLAVGFIRAEGDMMEDDYLTSEAAEVHSYLPNSVNLTISPNPFNLRANINFELLSPAKVTLKAYDLTGREVAIIANGDFTSGKHSLVWNAQNLPSGIYFIQLDAGGITYVSRALLMK